MGIPGRHPPADRQGQGMVMSPHPMGVNPGSVRTAVYTTVKRLGVPNEEPDLEIT